MCWQNRYAYSAGYQYEKGALLFDFVRRCQADVTVGNQEWRAGERVRLWICSTAQRACSAMRGSGSSERAVRTGRSWQVPMLPNATQILRTNRGRLMRLTGDSRKRVRNSSSVSIAS